MNERRIGHLALLLALTAYLMPGAAAQATEQVVITAKSGLPYPGTDHPWTADEYEAVYDILVKLPPQNLPDASSAVFQRMVNPENLMQARDTGTAMADRLLLIQRILLATAKITKLYLPSKSTPERPEEVAGFEAIFLHELGTLMSEIHEFQTTRTQSDELKVLLDPKVQKIRVGLDQIILDMIVSLKTSRSATAKAQLTQAFNDEYANLAPYLSEKTQAAAKTVLGN